MLKSSNILLKISIVLTLCAILVSETVAFENELTHPKITQKAVERSVLASDYIQEQSELMQ